MGFTRVTLFCLRSLTVSIEFSFESIQNYSRQCSECTVNVERAKSKNRSIPIEPGHLVIIVHLISEDRHIQIFLFGLLLFNQKIQLT